jgi:undecaprenyl-diphosphatase
MDPQDLQEAIVYGIIQGLTEWLPVSSTAHLAVVPPLLDYSERGAAFTAVIQLGTLAAALIYFRADIARLARGFFTGLVRDVRPWDRPDSRQAWMIILGTVPVVVCGLAFRHQIKGSLRRLTVIGGAAVVLALVLAAAEVWARRRARHAKQRGMDDLGWLDALVVGCWQAVALIPGASRSGVTITGALFRGMARDTAARFSFLLSLPAVFAAGVFELWEERKTLLASQSHALALALATAVSGVVGYASIAFLLRYLKTHTTFVFIAYRLVFGALLFWAVYSGRLADGLPGKESQPERNPAGETRALAGGSAYGR